MFSYYILLVALFVVFGMCVFYILVSHINWHKTILAVALILCVLCACFVLEIAVADISVRTAIWYSEMNQKDSEMHRQEMQMHIETLQTVARFIDEQGERYRKLYNDMREDHRKEIEDMRKTTSGL